MPKIQEIMRKQISDRFTKNEKYKRLFGKELIREDLAEFVRTPQYEDVIREMPGNEHLTEEEVKRVQEGVIQDIAKFNDFTTYFVGFYDNRKNMYVADDKATSIAHRMIDENLPKFVDNMDVFERIAASEVAAHFNELYKAIGLESLSECFQIAREIEPQAKLLLSDRQALTSISEDPMLDMLELADWLVNTCGVKIDGLVLSANLRRLDVGPQSMETRLDRIASQLTDIPIHISGLAVNTDEEDLQGDMLRDYMLLFYSHPAVASVSLGELWDAAQLSPKMGWYHGDFTEHPSLGIIRKLLDDDWRTNSVLATNEEGVASGNCFIGDYRVTVSSEGEEERQITFSLPPLAGRADGKIAVQRDGVTVTHTKDATVIDVKVE